MSGDYRGRTSRPLAAGARSLQSVLDGREEALATLLERPGGPMALLRRYGGKPEMLGCKNGTTRRVVRVSLKRGVPGEVLDIQMCANGAAADRVFYRCLSISRSDRIELTPQDYSATWYAAQLFLQDMKVQTPSSWGRWLGRSKTVHAVPTPKSAPGAACRICGRRKLSRQEYEWRRRNGYAVWRCRHRRPSPSARRDLLEAGGVIAALALCILVVGF